MTTLLICFDGSENAQHAILEAGRLFPGAHATIAYVWPKPVMPTSAYIPGQIVVPLEMDPEVQRQAAENSMEIAERGARAARDAGLAAEASPLDTTDSVWHALLELARSVDAQVIVAGSRGLGTIKSVLLGSTSAALAHHSELPVLIVPPST